MLKSPAMASRPMPITSPLRILRAKERRCMNMALKHARLAPEKVGYVTPSTSTGLGDVCETKAIKLSFGPWAREGLVGQFDKIHDRPPARGCWGRGIGRFGQSHHRRSHSPTHQSG
ncbi:MAG: hypothetical protein R3F31_12495 [Verrucomicrobiales bacterium]